MNIDTRHLKTVRNFANSITLKNTGKHPSLTTIYNCIESGELPLVEIDGIKFIDVSKIDKRWEKG